MADWFPDTSDAEGLEEARKAGFFGALAFCAMICLGVILLVAFDRTPTLDQPTTDNTLPFIGMAIELGIVATAAWRFKIGKGAIWGALVLVLFIVEVIGKIAAGTTNVGWLIAYAAIALALLNGVRGAWARRINSPTDVFE
ncbi:MAG: hypothetical protein R3D89_02285 [Sphingomonadaceae bacterium]